MDETCVPAEYQCSKGILKLLTETDPTCAKEWREHCWEYHKRKKEKEALDVLSVGSKIKIVNQFSLNNGIKPGDEIILTKKQGTKRKFWTDGYYHWGKQLIPDKYDIVA